MPAARLAEAHQPSGFTLTAVSGALMAALGRLRPERVESGH